MTIWQSSNDSFVRPFFFAGTGLLTAALRCCLYIGTEGLNQFVARHTQTPFIANNRFVNYPLRLLALFVSRLTDNIGLLQLVISLAYGAIPLLALGLSW